MAPENIFESFKRLQEESDEDFDFLTEGYERSIDEVVDDLLGEGADEEIYRVKVLRNPNHGSGRLIFPVYGYLRHVPEYELQFWSFPGDADSTLPLKDLLRLRVDRYKAGELDKDKVWETLCWSLDGTDGEEVVQINNSGMLISIWYDDDRDKGLLLQILGAG